MNTVVKRGMNDDGIVDIARYFRGSGVVVRGAVRRHVDLAEAGDVREMVDMQRQAAPQSGFSLTRRFGFRGRRIQPLCHPSAHIIPCECDPAGPYLHAPRRGGLLRRQHSRAANAAAPQPRECRVRL